MKLTWHSYRYFPYEKHLALREIQSLLSTSKISECEDGYIVSGPINQRNAERLVYYSKVSNGSKSFSTIQAKIEQQNGNHSNRQSTRYAVHGIHEYKGKFNPQIAKAILNILNIPTGSRIFDPFCGSGTTLVESSLMGMNSTGTDLNPLAVYIANAKLTSLNVPSPKFKRELDRLVASIKSEKHNKCSQNKGRESYLKQWFAPDVFNEIEMLKSSIEQCDPICIHPFLCIASNLLRDYSHQDPHDLRIRRRKTSIPNTPFHEAFITASLIFISRLGAAQKVVHTPSGNSSAYLFDSRSILLSKQGLGTRKFDCAITSPPYAMALPYIDTQRLSLVWLDLIHPSQILSLESKLVGSREFRGEIKKQLYSHLDNNNDNLPADEHDTCLMLKSSLSQDDGFRRRAVPILLYRYFVQMSDVFRAVRSCMKKGAPFALVVGSNHTVLGGNRIDINTPVHLSNLAQTSGWCLDEFIPLQTYKRYGYHVNNAVNSETLLLLRAS